MDLCGQVKHTDAKTSASTWRTEGRQSGKNAHGPASWALGLAPRASSDFSQGKPLKGGPTLQVPLTMGASRVQGHGAPGVADTGPLGRDSVPQSSPRRQA